MDKIIYTCYADHIGYSFPKRKWWETFIRRALSFSDPRENVVRIEEIFSQKRMGIEVRILERTVQDAGAESGQVEKDAFLIHIPDTLYDEVCREFIQRSCKGKHFEVLLAADLEGRKLAHLMQWAAVDMNYLAVYTKNTQVYEKVLEQIEQESGLIGMLFTDPKEWKQYQRMICENRKPLVFLGNTGNGREENAGSVFYHVPKESFVLDLRDDMASDGTLMSRRMGKNYVSLRSYLDNIVKNSYNSLVNEGLRR